MSEPTPLPEREREFPNLSPEALARIPGLSQTELILAKRRTIHLHFVLIHCHWYVAAFDGKDTFFGFIDPGDSDLAEWGYFRLSELRNARTLVPMVDPRTGESEGLIPVAVELDAYWQPKRFGQIDQVNQEISP